MCNRVNLGDMDNSTVDSIYDFFFTSDVPNEKEKSESQHLSNITCVGVILCLILFILILFVAIRKLQMEQAQEITMDDAILMNRIEALRNEMDTSELKTPDDAISQYQMKNNRTPNNTSQEDPGYQEFSYVNSWME